MDDADLQREDKSTSFTLSITLLLMAVLIIVAWALKRNAADHARPAQGDQVAAAGLSRPAASGAAEPSIPVGNDGHPKSEYQIITDCRLEEDPANDGDTFRVATPQGSHLFRLYWVQTVQMSGASPAVIREAMDHFGLKTEDQLRELAVDARDFTLNTLRSVHFRLVTRWEKDPTDGAWLCFAYPSDGAPAHPTLQNLALLLVQNGLAVIRPCNRPLPEPETSAGDFQNMLTAAEADARRTLSGGWAGKGG
jgi:endonuclease YncB( thermonuclease family)